MLRLARDPRVLRLLAIVVGGVFVYASWDKVLAPADFARIVYHYRLIGPNAWLGPQPANLLAITLPWVELVTGLLMIAGLWRREAAVSAAGMLVMFLVAISWALMLGIDIENCGCFSVTGAGRGFGLKLLVTDAVLLIAAGLVVVGPAARDTADAAEPMPSPDDEPAAA
jgi:uncharacterized membrane protein YphA (DoxX/SURF4 family)